jgi:NitT/TauT family transport system permease protein
VTAEATGAQAAGTGNVRRGSLWRFADRHQRALFGTLGGILTVATWQAITSFGVTDPLLFPSPLATAESFWDLFASGEVQTHLFSSLRLLFTAFGAAVVSGTLIGFVAGRFALVRRILTPHLAFLYSTPSIGLMPLFIVFLGLGFASQFWVVVLLAFFPCYYSALDAVTTADAALVRMARSFSASDRRLFLTVVLPGSVPLLMAGYRIALGKAIVGVLLVELYSSAEGLGYLLNLSGIQFNTAKVFAIILVVALIGLSLSLLFRWIEGRFDRWRPGATQTL